MSDRRAVSSIWEEPWRRDERPEYRIPRILYRAMPNPRFQIGGAIVHRSPLLKRCERSVREKMTLNPPGRERTGESVSFVMSLWMEPREVEADPEWRWRVLHVQSGEESYFKNLDDLLEFVATKSGVSAPQ